MKSENSLTPISSSLTSISSDSILNNKSEVQNKNIVISKSNTKESRSETKFNEEFITLLYHFEICDEIDERLKSKIILFHVFDDQLNQKNILFVTSDDKVFALGHNSYGVCGVGYGFELKETTEVPELTGKSVAQFRHGANFVLALTDDHKIYSWGANDCGQLARGFISNKYLKPAIINFYLNVFFVDISCGERHAMALTSDGNVYAWGDNTFVQIEFDLLPSNRFSIIKLKHECLHLTHLSLPKIKTIYCSNHQSFAITTNGQVYCWGLNHNHKLATGHKRTDIDTYTRIGNISKIKTISSSHYNTYFLDEDGHLYFSGRFIEDGTKHQQRTPRLIEFDGKIISMLPNINLQRESKVCILVEDLIRMEVYYLEGDQVIRTSIESYFEYCLIAMQTTPETFHISAEQNLSFKSRQVSSSKLFLARSEIRTTISKPSCGSFYIDKSEVNKVFAVKTFKAKGIYKFHIRKF